MNRHPTFSNTLLSADGKVETKFRQSLVRILQETAPRSKRIELGKIVFTEISWDFTRNSKSRPAKITNLTQKFEMVIKESGARNAQRINAYDINRYAGQ